MKQYFISLFAFFLCIITYSQNNNLIIIEDLDQDHPLLEYDRYQKLFGYELNDLLDISSQNEKTIENLFYSMNYYLKEDTCINVQRKQHFVEILDSLKKSFDVFLENAHEVESLSYGNGHQAGRRSLILKIIMQEQFIRYLEYWFNTMYYVYLEPGVIDCREENE